MKLRAVHLLTNPDDQRERRSISEVSQLIQFGIEYFALINPKYEGELPPAREAIDRPFALTQGHYGCYQAHRDAILTHLTPDLDGLLVFECDAQFVESIENFHNRIKRAKDACGEGGLTVFTFGPKHASQTIARVGSDIIVITQFIETHAYYIPQASFGIFTDLFSKPWDALDYCYTIYLYDQAKLRIGTFRDRPTSVQGVGHSLLDGKPKVSESHWRYHFYSL